MENEIFNREQMYYIMLVMAHAIKTGKIEGDFIPSDDDLKVITLCSFYADELKDKYTPKGVN